ncbi:MAG: DUF5719 family protein [Actinomycetota bacterium]
MRWPVVFILLGLVAAGLAYDRSVELPAAVETEATLTTVISPSLVEPPRLDAAWYCPVGSSAPGSFAVHEVAVSNLSEDPAVANLSVLTGDGPGPGQRIELAPFSTERVSLSDTLVEQIAGAVVEITGGRGAVGHSVTTPQGVAEGPCATSASNTWYFAAGRTSFDSTQYLALMNPFPETAVFDVEFQAVGRSRKPGPLQGAFVKARSVRIIDVGEFVAREEALATKITTKRGRLVVERLQLLDGQLGPSGAALQLGVPTPAKSWIFTAGRVHDAGDDLLTVYNPYSADEASEAAGDDAAAEGGVSSLSDEREGFVNVAIELWPDNPTDLSDFSVVTIEREVRPGTFAVIDLRAQAERFEFPLPYELGVNVTSVSDTDDALPIVAERWQFGQRVQREGITAASADEAAVDVPGEEQDPSAVEEPGFVLQPPEPVASGLPQPIATDGISTSRGNELFSPRWVIPWVSMTGDSTLLAIAAIQEASVEVRILSDGQLVGPVRATVPAGGRTIIPISSPDDGAAIEISSNTAISVEASVVVPDVTLDVVPAVPTVRG